MKKEIKYLVMSDLHFGHKTNTIDVMGNNLIHFFNSYKEVIKDIDILFLAGDIFDNYIPSYTDTYLKITKVLIEVIKWCQHYNVKLRVLEGTPSHDWRQASVISTIIKDLEIKIDYKYIDKVDIETMEDYKINILYVPDQVKPKGEEVYKIVQKVLKEKNLNTIDIGIMHGQFHYQFPKLKLDSSHNEEDYLSIVKHYIHIGHIHNHTSKGRIIAQGSFDRIAHGEEEDKGCVLSKINLEDEKQDEWMFLVNKQSMVFKTLNYLNQSSEDLINRLRKDLKSIIKGSSIRLVINEESKELIKTKAFKDLTKDYQMKYLYPDKEKIKLGDIIIKEDTIDSFTITKENILELVSQEFKNNNLIEDGHLDLLKVYI